MAAENRITVRALKFDRKEHKRWRARINRYEGSLIVLDAVFDIEVQHDRLGLIRRGTLTREYYWLDRWYNVFAFLDADGRVTSFYCNINMPPRFDGQELCYVDLDVDVLVTPRLSYEILDVEEFELNAAHYLYPNAVIDAAHVALDELITLIEARVFPFSLATTAE